MYKNLLAGSIAIFTIGGVFAQTPIDVTDQTIKIGAASEEVLYFGFAKGDKIIFNFKEVNGKELKEIEISEYPDNSKFSEFKASIVESKSIITTKQAVYIFRFKNAALAGRICKINIQRLPASDGPANFNTDVTWITKLDTTWNSYIKDVLVGYDTLREQKSKLELVKSEVREELIMDKVQRVHSQTNESINKTWVSFTLPPNTSTVFETQNVIAWAYWIGVGEEANKAWQSNIKTISTLAKGVAGYFTTPLGAFAVGKLTELVLPTIGEDVQYSLCDRQNADLFMSGQKYVGWDFGNGIAGYKKFSASNLLQGTYYVCMSNDNYMQGIDANVKVIAMIETKNYEYRPYTETKVSPRFEKKIFRDPVVTTSRIPITGD